MNTRDNRIEPTIGAVDGVVPEIQAPRLPPRNNSLMITSLVIHAVAGLVWFATLVAVMIPNLTSVSIDAEFHWMSLLFFGLSLLNLVVPLLALRFQRQLRSAYALSLFSAIFLLIFLRNTPLGIALILTLLIAAGVQRVVLRRVSFFSGK